MLTLKNCGSISNTRKAWRFKALAKSRIISYRNILIDLDKNASVIENHKVIKELIVINYRVCVRDAIKLSDSKLNSQ